MLLTGYDRELEAGDVGLHGIEGFFSSLASGLKSGVGQVFSAGVDVAKNAAYSYAGIKPPAPVPQITMTGGGDSSAILAAMARQQAAAAAAAADAASAAAAADAKKKGGGFLAGLPGWALPVGGLAAAGLVFMMLRKPKAAHNPRRRRKARKARKARRGRR